MGFQADPFGHEAYKYDPTLEVAIERNPDKLPSSSHISYSAQGDSYICVMRVRGLGAITMRATADYDDPKGKLVFNGLATFTDEDIQFD
jgi:hypothetical protein